MSNKPTKPTLPTSSFGFRQLPSEQKTSRVQEVFSSVAGRYDLMNDLISGGVHRWWKWYLLNLVNYSHAVSILDLACGSGDLLLGHAKRRLDDCRLIGIDPNPEMLAQAKLRLANQGIFDIELLTAAAEELPLEDNSQSIVSISFGLRNTTNMQRSIEECFRVLQPTGRLLILEFSRPSSSILQQAYASYSKLIPHIGKLVTNDRNSYQYLVDSIQTHPDQKTLGERITAAGFGMVHWINLSGGIVAIHSGYKH